IRIYEPAILIVGTRGRSLGGFQGLLPGSVSKYCLQHSPVPVIVVRPSSKRDKKKRKRLRDPRRGGYRDILDKTEEVTGLGGHLLDERNRMSIVVGGGEALGGLGLGMGTHDAEEEARLVAQAIGYRADGRNEPGKIDDAAGWSPLTKTTSATSAHTARSLRSDSLGSSTAAAAAASPEDLRSVSTAPPLRSPEFRALDGSPHPSSADDNNNNNNGEDDGDEEGSDVADEYESEDDEIEAVSGQALLVQEEAARKAHERAVREAEDIKEGKEEGR
ncbi:hypothetical protein LTR28_003155, partial [Elasticomyces elasticus]